MKSTFLFIVFFSSIISLNCVNAQNSPLWEISGNGLVDNSYLMGTLKFTGEHEFYFPESIQDYIKKCQVFAIEDQVDHHAQHELNKAIHLPKGQSLKTQLSETDYNRVRDFFHTEFGVSHVHFDTHYSKLIPLALSITMTRLSLGEKLKFYDIELLKIAKANKVKTYSLEPISREAEALHKFPMEEQVKALLESVDNFEDQKNEFISFINAFHDHDIEKVFQFTLHPTETNELFYNEFYIQRNLEWMPKITKMISKGPSFIAVGVTHLKGDQGIIKLLQEKGYELKSVKL